MPEARIPTWRECADRKGDGHELSALESFIFENEPVGAPGTVIPWRRGLALLVGEVAKEAKRG